MRRRAKLAIALGMVVMLYGVAASGVWLGEAWAALMAFVGAFVVGWVLVLERKRYRRILRRRLERETCATLALLELRPPARRVANTAGRPSSTAAPE